MTINKFLFDDPINRMTARNMSFMVRRSELIAGNIANADTPGYKARDIEFSDVLRRIASGGDAVGKARIATTNPKHFTGVELEPEDVRVVEDRESHSVDGNSVNVEEQLEKNAEIALKFDLLATYLKHKAGLVREALDDTF